MKKTHVIILITGLGSSIPLIGFIWSYWARKMEKRFKEKYKLFPNVVIFRVSSDGNGEKKAFEFVFELSKKGELGDLYVAGHSNGFRDGLRWLEKFYPFDIECKYFGGIDMALADDYFSAEAWGNIIWLDEFHGVLEYANIDATFREQRRTHQVTETRKGHTASANDEKVQNRIFLQVTARLDKTLAVEEGMET